MTTDLDKFIEQSMADLWIEAKVVKKIVKALNEAHNPITSINDGEEIVVVEAGNLDAINHIVFNLDECYLETASGQWVFLVLGNGWDCLSDYNTSLEEILAPVNAYIEKHNR